MYRQVSEEIHITVDVIFEDDEIGFILSNSKNTKKIPISHV